MEKLVKLLINKQYLLFVLLYIRLSRKNVNKLGLETKLNFLEEYLFLSSARCTKSFHIISINFRDEKIYISLVTSWMKEDVHFINSIIVMFLSTAWCLVFLVLTTAPHFSTTVIPLQLVFVNVYSINYNIFLIIIA